MIALANNTAVFHRRRNEPASYSGLVQGSFKMHRLIVDGGSSQWNTFLSSRFNHLCSLEAGWDGYRGVPVSFACARFAATILEHLYTDGLPAPALVPGSDGTLQIEWHRNQFDIELDVLAPNRVAAYRFDHLSGSENEIDVENDFTVVSSWLQEMKVARQVLDIAGH